LARGGIENLQAFGAEADFASDYIAGPVDYSPIALTKNTPSIIII